MAEISIYEDERAIRWLQMIANGIPHESGKCPEPELCSALIEHDLKLKEEICDEIRKA